MSAELSVISFVLAVLLAAYIPVERVRNNVATLAIVLWLATINLIHGINAIQWAGNVDMSGPAWCDIVTRISLASYMAIPAACICMSRELEMRSSQRKFSTDLLSVRIWAFMDILLCYAVPMLYLILHYIVQSHRFDVIEDYGCFASIHPSGPAAFVITVPPTVMCSISFIFSGLTIRNILRNEQPVKISNVLGPVIHRRLAISISMTLAVLIFLIVSVASMPILLPWISFAQVHEDITKINIVRDPGQVLSLRRTWWGLFALSVLYVVLLVFLGEETRDMYRLVVKHWRQLHRRAETKPPLPLYLPTKVQSTSQSPPQQTVELKSGWDDMPEFNTPPRSFFCSLRISKPKATQVPPTPTSYAAAHNLTPLTTNLEQRPNSSFESTATADNLKDDAFMSNTLRYLESPTARSLGISPPSPVYVSLIKGAEHLLPAVDSSSHRTKPVLDKLTIPQSESAIGNKSPAGLTSTRSGKETLGSSAISSVLDASWPLPPVTPMTPSTRYKSLQ